jgi:membrane protein
MSIVAAAMSFYAMFSFVPAISAMVLMYAWISDPSTISEHVNQVSEVLPGEMQTIIESQLTSLSETTAVGFGAISAVVLALWAASRVARNLMEGLNMIYDEEERRNFFKSNGIALALTVFGIILSILAVVVIVGLPAFFSQFNLGALVQAGIGAASWLILLGFFSLFLSVVYKFGPSRQNPQWRWVSWGAGIAAVLWAVASLGFTFYASNFGNYNETYGSLGAIVVVMMWFFITFFVILLGAEINAEVEHQTQKDSTTGSPKPMGRRGAHKADTVGEEGPRSWKGFIKKES